MTRRSIKIFGERNTGTKYLSELLRLNVEAEELPGVPPRWTLPIERVVPGPGEWVEDLFFALTYFRNLGWKHQLVHPDRLLRSRAVRSGSLLFVTVTKNPYAWLLSLYRRPYHQHFPRKPGMETFLSTEWKAIRRENAGKSFPNPIALWNAKNQAYIRMRDGLPVLNLRYEDILQDPRQALERICKRLSLPWNGEGFRNYLPSTKDKKKDFYYYQAHYREERWRKKLTPAMIATINASLDRELMALFEYEILQS